MRLTTMFGPSRGRLAVVALLAAGLLALAACGGDDEEAAPPPPAPPAEEPAPPPAEEPAPPPAEEPPAEEPPAEEPPATGGGMIQAEGACGAGTGEAASGEPIKIGAIVTNVPGIDFTWIGGMAGAYFQCVNDNGGINGRPVEFIMEEETLDPQQISQLATKLIDQDQVVGLVGSTSIIDCSVNGAYYVEQGFYPIIAGVDHACFTTPNFSAVNMGPYYSSLGGAQAAVRAGATGKLVIASPNAPGFDLVNSGVVDFAAANGMEGISILEDVPIADPAGFAQRLVQEAGEGGGVVLDFTGPAVLPVLQAIEQQGLIDAVIWASSTPPNDPSVAAELSEAWNGKFLINAEFNVLDSGLPDQNHMNEIREQYASDIPSSSFAQMGYLAGRFATEALLSIEGDITKESVNEAFKALVNLPSDMLCKPWYFDSTVGANVSNNTDITVAPMDGNMVLVEECFEIAELDSEANQLAAIRAAEQELGLNTG
jgi:branched-chain amino acid transport system substrate-binding protein